ncbi:sirohydrochlorin cobaltochelatase [Vibrio sp. PP-XX7]
MTEDVKLAEENHSALVYMGHGNEHLSTGLYYELGELMNQIYPQVHTYIGLVEGHPDFETVLKQIRADGVTRVTLKPLMVVAGDHANNDMAGDEGDSWKVRLTNAQIQVIPILKGLGSKASIQAIYLSHLADAARDTGITLK